MITRYQATGLTCGHCAQAVTEELAAIDGVSSAEVELMPDGASTLTVASDQPIEREAIAAALDEAGDYALVDQ